MILLARNSHIFQSGVDRFLNLSLGTNRII